jgi:tRNA nucleotidyltransferase/poly(A) polymerase
LCEQREYLFEEQSRIILKNGLNQGKELVSESSLPQVGEKFEVDFRGTENNYDLIEDRKSRDLTINGLYMWFDIKSDKAFIDYPPGVSICCLN